MGRTQNIKTTGENRNLYEEKLMKYIDEISKSEGLENSESLDKIIKYMNEIENKSEPL